jgi:hypothetical protein
MRFVIVNPREYKPGKHLIVLDDLHRQIKYRPEGNRLKLTMHISRRLKDRDLVLVAPKQEG